MFESVLVVLLKVVLSDIYKKMRAPTK